MIGIFAIPVISIEVILADVAQLNWPALWK